MKKPELSVLKQRDVASKVEQFRLIPPKKLEMNDPIGPRSRTATSSGLSPYQGPWDSTVVAHLLKRTLFGFKKEEFNQFSGMSLSGALDRLLVEDPVPDPPVNDYYYPEEDIIDPDIAPGETWIEAPYGFDYEGYRILSLKGWLIDRILYQPATIHEKMILFWHNLLVTQSWGVFVAKASYQYFMTLRSHALGNFRELVKAITLDPSMLIYLNGTFNNKEAPDENYARELQELFCIGKGPNANFTEEDVQAAARVLTGWVIDWESFEFAGKPTSYFYPPFHETSDKQFSAFYGSTVITGRGVDGADELDDLLDMIFANDETALYLCRRLYQFFVYSEIDQSVEDNVIVPLAQLLRDSNYEIAPVLRTLLESEHFFDPANQGAMIKNPADFLLGLWRSLEINPIGEPNSLERLLNYRSLLWNMADQGMEIADPPSVSGWPAYYQAPQYDKYWITTDTITSRAINTDSLWFWGFWIFDGMTINADLIDIVSRLNQPDDPVAMLREITQFVLGIPADDALINSIKFILLNGQEQDYYWTSAWQQMIANPDDEALREVVNNRLKLTFQYIFQLGECQLM